MNNFRQNTSYKILTSTGFRYFDGILLNEKNTIKIKFSTGKYFVCTLDHRILYKNKWVLAKTIKPNYIICDNRVVSITINGTQIVYDPINVDGNNSYISDGIVSHNCEFLGSSATLISGPKLASIPTNIPIYEQDFLKIFNDPEKSHSYVCTVDTSRGQHLDYSAFIVFDITTLPYQVVATYKNNTISSMAYPYIIEKICTKYNNAHILVEINDIGGQVADILHFESEYENMYFTYKDDLNEGMGYPGVRTTKKVKSIGCSTLKDFIEQDQLIVNSQEILTELYGYTQKGSSYAAEDTNINDDLCACLFLFAWLTRQPLFAELNDTNIRAILAKKTESYIEENMMPFGEMSDGREEYQSTSIELDISKHRTADPLDSWMYS